LLFVDLDDFKSVNDTLGHSIGDQVLRQVGERFREFADDGVLVVRLGGDEFALVIDQCSDETSLALAERTVRALDRPVRVADNDLQLSANVGITSIDAATRDADPDADPDTGPPSTSGPRPGGPGAAVTSESLLRDADLALYAAKARGRGRWARFHPSMHQRSRQRMELLTALRQAVGRGDLRLHYQPLVDLSSGKVHSIEALLRWDHAGQPVGPDRFVALAEESGLILQIGRWALLQACRDLARLRRTLASAANLSVAVNVSARQLVDPAFRSDVVQSLADTGVPPRNLTIEITETTLDDRFADTVPLLQSLRDLGVRIAIDDFGTGYSSLSRISQLPADILKIDKSFITPLDESSDPSDSALTISAAIVNLAQSLGLDTVAEGIETQRQWAALQRQQCRYGQGFLFARPTPLEQLAAVLDAPAGPAPGFRDDDAPGTAERPDPIRQ
jgi:predicted signal transduction protein with EAL and GGDEF domain